MAVDEASDDIHFRRAQRGEELGSVGAQVDNLFRVRARQRKE